MADTAACIIKVPYPTAGPAEPPISTITNNCLELHLHGTSTTSSSSSSYSDSIAANNHVSSSSYAKNHSAMDHGSSSCCCCCCCFPTTQASSSCSSTTSIRHHSRFSAAPPTVDVDVPNNCSHAQQYIIIGSTMHEYNHGMHNGDHHYNHGMDAPAKSMPPNNYLNSEQASNELPTVISNNNNTSCLSNCHHQMERLNGLRDLGGPAAASSSSVNQLQRNGGNINNGHIHPSNHATTNSRNVPGAAHEQLLGRPSLWYEEEIDENLRWCFGLKSILHTGVSPFQEIALLDTQPFGKVLTLDGKMQSAEVDEWVYHECLVHPALLLHQRPQYIFIMGGGEGSTAREVLKHDSIAKVVMCDIDEEVVKFCSACLTTNHEAFESPKLELVINDARLELECRNEKFDIIIGDLADPLEWGPCYQLYSKGFYENVVKPKLNDDGIFVTQAGPAGVLSHKEVFTSIYNTLKQVFSHVVAYSAHVPSYADTWGWVMASNQPLNAISQHDKIDTRIRERIKGELQYLDGATLHASTILNKTVRQSLANEKHIYTEDSARFLYGHGRSIHISTH